jgi:hypothetical protein
MTRSWEADNVQGLFFFAGFFSILIVLIPTGLLLGLLVVFTLRGDPDDAGGRASALYLSMASFVALFTALAAVVGLSMAIVDLVADDDDGPDQSSAFDEEDGFESEGSFGEEIELFGGDDSGQDADDKAISAAVASLITLLVSGGILAFHLPRLDRVGAGHLAGTGAWRVRRSYRLVTCLTAVVIVLVSASLSLYGVYSIAAPGVSGGGDRGDAIEGLVPILVLLAGAAVIFWLHWDDEKAPPVTAEVAP